MADTSGSHLNRRTFVQQAGGAFAAISAAGVTAQSYARVVGANERIRLGQLGCGARSKGHVHMVELTAKHMPVETVAVCDIWSLAREERAAQVKSAFGRQPQVFKYSEEMLSRSDIDGVMIATGDFQHAKLCTEVVRAGKDCYVEKPFANVLAEAKEARDVVMASKQVVQMGTQHRTQPYQLAVRDIIRSGRIGEIVHIEQEWNVNEPRWRYVENDTGRTAEMLTDTKGRWKEFLYGRQSKLREEDTDWKRWLLGKPDRPFDPHVYLEFRLYKDFSAGVFDQWLSHGSDLVHLWTDEKYPHSVTATGGIFAWQDGRENPDTCVTAVTYPKGFLYTYKTVLGNSYRSFARIMGRDGTIANYGGEGASLFIVSKEGGRKEYEEGKVPVYRSAPSMGPPEAGAEIVHVPGAAVANTLGPDDDDADHLADWLRAMRDRRQPSANVSHGFSHAIVCIMAAQSYWSGKRLYWDSKKEEIVDQPV